MNPILTSLRGQPVWVRIMGAGWRGPKDAPRCRDLRWERTDWRGDARTPVASNEGWINTDGWTDQQVQELVVPLLVEAAMQGWVIHAGRHVRETLRERGVPIAVEPDWSDLDYFNRPTK